MFFHLFALIFTHSVFALQQNTPVAFKFCILYLCLMDHMAAGEQHCAARWHWAKKWEFPVELSQ